MLSSAHVPKVIPSVLNGRSPSSLCCVSSSKRICTSESSSIRFPRLAEFAELTELTELTELAELAELAELTELAFLRELTEGWLHLHMSLAELAELAELAASPPERPP